MFLLLPYCALLMFSFTVGEVDLNDAFVGNQTLVTENNTEEVEAPNNFDSLERSRRPRIVLVVQPTGCIKRDSGVLRLATREQRRICDGRNAVIPPADRGEYLVDKYQGTSLLSSL